MLNFFQFFTGIGMDEAVAEDGHHHHHHHHHESLSEHREHCRAKHGKCPYEQRERRDQDADDLGSKSPARRYIDDLNKRHDEENEWKKKYMALKAKMAKKMMVQRSYSSSGCGSGTSISRSTSRSNFSCHGGSSYYGGGC